MRFAVLDWDTAFFGVKIARIDSPLLTTSQLAETLSELKGSAVELVYWPSARECNFAEMKRLGGYLLDTKTTFLVDPRADGPKGPVLAEGVELYAKSMPLSDLEALAVQGGEHSRFARDPRVPREKFVALYKSWIGRSVAKEIAREVLVIREGDRVVGMVTLGERDGRGEIGLIAVDTNSRGRGYGRKLVHAAQRWFANEQLVLGQVVTQGKNLEACSLYASCGYSVEKVEYFYHFWL